MIRRFVRGCACVLGCGFAPVLAAQSGAVAQPSPSAPAGVVQTLRDDSDVARGELQRLAEELEAPGAVTAVVPPALLRVLSDQIDALLGDLVDASVDSYTLVTEGGVAAGAALDGEAPLAGAGARPPPAGVTHARRAYLESRAELLRFYTDLSGRIVAAVNATQALRDARADSRLADVERIVTLNRRIREAATELADDSVSWTLLRPVAPTLLFGDAGEAALVLGAVFSGTRVDSVALSVPVLEDPAGAVVELAADRCSGRVLGAGDTCVVRLRFAHAHRLRTGTVDVVVSAPALVGDVARSVQHQSFAYAPATAADPVLRAAIDQVAAVNERLRALALHVDAGLGAGADRDRAARAALRDALGAQQRDAADALRLDVDRELTQVRTVVDQRLEAQFAAYADAEATLRAAVDAVLEWVEGTLLPVTADGDMLLKRSDVDGLEFALRRQHTRLTELAQATRAQLDELRTLVFDVVEVSHLTLDGRIGALAPGADAVTWPMLADPSHWPEEHAGALGAVFGPSVPELPVDRYAALPVERRFALLSVVADSAGAGDARVRIAYLSPTGLRRVLSVTAGAPLPEGWSLASIDGVASLVRLAHPDGRSLRLQ